MRRGYGWLFQLGFLLAVLLLVHYLAEAAAKAFSNPRYRREEAQP
ncbi:hypothetical protein [Oceanithermus sp.]|nr:hypothetical protein [Oceanithermus sp.]